VLSDDFMTVDVEAIKHLVSVMTVVGGNVVYAAHDFSHYNPPLPPVSPDWSPVGRYGGYCQDQYNLVPEFAQNFSCAVHGSHQYPHKHSDKYNLASALRDPFWGSLGCTCFAF
jgi:hypothetical protein